MDTDSLITAATAGDTAAIAELEMVADKTSQDGDRTILHIACTKSDTERVKFVLTKFANKNLLVKVDKKKQTALHLAAARGYAKVVEILIDAARNFFPSSFSNDPLNSLSRVQDFLRQVNYTGNTALHQAVTSGDVATVEQLVKADPNDRHVQNLGSYTPVYQAAISGYNDIVKMICKTCTAPSLDGPDGTTAVHAAISQLHQAKTSDKDIVMVLMDSAKRSLFQGDAPHVPQNNFEALFNKTDHENRTLLSLAVLKNYPEVVTLILKEDPAYKRGIGSKKSDLKFLISMAVREGNNEIIKILCEKSAAGTEHASHILLIDAIKGGEKEIVFALLAYEPRLVTCETFTKWTALHYAAFHNFDSIIDAIVKAQDDVHYRPVYGGNVETPHLVAARQRHTSTVLLLMKLLPVLSCVAVNSKGQNILHIAVVQSNKDMIRSILEYCPKSCTNQILNAKDGDGNTPLHLLISHGCFVAELIKHKEVDVMAENNQNWTPLEMLYFQDEIVADQVKIKKLLDDTQATKHEKFRSVPVSARSLKDAEMKKHKKDMIRKELEEMKEENEQIKEEIERYRKRGNTQIIVTALITTVTFTVGFTMPGGYYQSGEADEGLVILSHKKAFNIFMVSDALALALSITSLFVYFISSMYDDDPDQVSKFDAASTVLNIISVIAMMLTFIAGIYVVLSHSPGLAITVCIICSLFFFSTIVLLIKMIYDRKIRKNKMYYMIANSRKLKV